MSKTNGRVGLSVRKVVPKFTKLPTGLKRGLILLYFKKKFALWKKRMDIGSPLEGGTTEEQKCFQLRKRTTKKICFSGDGG